MFSRLYLITIGFLLLLNGCALAAHGRTQMIPFSSTPMGAEVVINGESRGFTPLTLELRRNQSYDVVVKYDNQKQTLFITNIPESQYIALDVAPAAVSGAASIYICLDGLRLKETTMPTFDAGPIFCLMSLALTGALATPITVDAANGAWYYLSPDQINVTFGSP